MTASHEPYPEVDPDDPRFDDADISTAPFVDQPAYGSRLWQKPIKFVPASKSTPLTAPSVLDGRSFAEQYLAIVFPNGQPPPKTDAFPTCGICGAPVKESDDRMHYLSPVHQAALPEIHTPSGIDRTRLGLKLLQRHGFDVDARMGLGATGQGMLFPIVPKEKRDKLGLGVDKKLVDKERREALPPKGTTLDAGQVRKLATQQKKKHEKLQSMFYGDDKLEKYLGGGAVDHGLK
ncbi:uncharacterized protein N0V89_006306 [Didymosphaeria variabile]|uniref:G-patch domain-containing protein n=1 Tax=Didymosphaeria variabile TaxID=1932322 RepID=A0A9W8XNB7_9PLEO|nr:uncharacterized protein N0V89_006306 [Didymosphaeria variabile]KAJ4354569.1 hypothetical protein N0V89_006306 [Didymosphaeria variabile]